MKKQPEKVVDDLDSTEDGEASEKAHGASYQTQLGFHCHLRIIHEGNKIEYDQNKTIFRISQTEKNTRDIDIVVISVTNQNTRESCIAVMGPL